MASGGSRPGAGRKRKDPKLKLVTGTFRADRDVIVPEDTSSGPMIAPLHLSEIARRHFATIADILEAQKRASPHYAEVVGLLSIRLEQIARFQAVLDCSGDTYEAKTAGGGFMIRMRPEVRMLSDALRHAQSLLGDLMLSPASAMKIANGHKQEAGDFDDF